MRIENMDNWRVYKNGNYIVRFDLKTGTKIRETNEDEFIPSFAENMDIKLCNRCNMGCAFCHEGSTCDGKLGDILNAKFIDTLHPYQEVALGGGNVLEHPDLISFLEKLKDKKIIANMTVHQYHFEQNQELIRDLVDRKLIYGLGVSLSKPTEHFVSLIKQYPNAVIHVINGVFSPYDLEKLRDNDLKMLILGYKQLRRGEDWYNSKHEFISITQTWLKEELAKIINCFKVVSFDNLAIEQLEVKKLMSDEEWEEFYMGDDSQFTYYIDLVEEKFAKSSTAPFDERYDILDSVDDMFEKIRLRKA